MASNIDILKPVFGNPTTESVRANFSVAKSEIEAIQQVVNLKAGLSLANVFTNTNTVTTNSASAALNITQTGAGNALEVFDQASDTTPFVIDASGNVIVGNSSVFTGYGFTPRIQTIGNSATTSSLLLQCTNSATNPILVFANASSSNTGAVSSGQVLGEIRFYGGDGSLPIRGASIFAVADATPSTGIMPTRLAFFIADSAGVIQEVMRIRSDGNIALGGSGSVDSNLLMQRNITGGTTAYGYRYIGNASSDVTSVGRVFHSAIGTDAASFTLGALNHFEANQRTIGAGSTVTNQHGFLVSSNLIGATNNYAFKGQIPAGTGRWNLYMDGTAANYLAGDITLNAALIQTPTRSTVASGSTINLTTSTNHLVYDNAATVAVLTINLPSTSLSDGQVISICTRNGITALTLGGGTIYGAPTTLPAGGFATFIYSSASAAWFRKG